MHRFLFATIFVVVLLLLDPVAGTDKSLQDTDPYRIWNRFGGDATNSQYSSLGQISKTNVHQLEVAWTYHAGGAEERRHIQCNKRGAGTTEPRSHRRSKLTDPCIRYFSPKAQIPIMAATKERQVRDSKHVGTVKRSAVKAAVEKVASANGHAAERSASCTVAPVLKRKK